MRRPSFTPVTVPANAAPCARAVANGQFTKRRGTKGRNVMAACGQLGNDKIRARRYIAEDGSAKPVSLGIPAAKPASAAETAHVVGVAVVPDAAHDAPYPVETDTGSGVLLEDVRVLKLTMNFREHSLLLSVGAVTKAVKKATGALGEVLPEWYLLRRAAAGRLQLGYYPPLEELQRIAIADAHGFLINTGDAPASEPLVTSWVRGVDREGNAVRGVQAVLIVGAGKPTLTNLVAEPPVFATLPPRVLLPAPKFVERLDLACAKRAFTVVVLPAPAPASQACCSAIGAAAYFSGERVQFNVQPQGNVNPLLTGSISGVNAIRSQCSADV